MLFAVFGGMGAGLCLIFIAWSVYNESVSIPPKDLRRRRR